MSPNDKFGNSYNRATEEANPGASPTPLPQNGPSAASVPSGGTGSSFGRLVQALVPPGRPEGYSRAELMRSVFGVTPGETRCTGCDRVLLESDWPARACTCGRPFPRVCVTYGCPTLIEPRWHKTGNKKTSGWVDGDPMCGRCETVRVGNAHTALLRARMPHRAWAALGEVWSIEARREAFETLRAWAASPSTQPWVWLYGDPGTGKTVTAAWAINRALKSGTIATFRWMTETALLDALRAGWGDGRSPLIERAVEAPILVLDDLLSQGKTPYTPGVQRAMADILYQRLEAESPTIITGNNRPNKGLIENMFGAHIWSRLHSLSAIVYVGGSDLRRKAKEARDEYEISAAAARLDAGRKGGYY